VKIKKRKRKKRKKISKILKMQITRILKLTILCKKINNNKMAKNKMKINNASNKITRCLQIKKNSAEAMTKNYTKVNSSNKTKRNKQGTNLEVEIKNLKIF